MAGWVSAGLTRYWACRMRLDGREASDRSPLLGAPLLKQQQPDVVVAKLKNKHLVAIGLRQGGVPAAIEKPQLLIGTGATGRAVAQAGVNGFADGARAGQFDTAQVSVRRVGLIGCGVRLSRSPIGTCITCVTRETCRVPPMPFGLVAHDLDPPLDGLELDDLRALFPALAHHLADLEDLLHPRDPGDLLAIMPFGTFGLCHLPDLFRAGDAAYRFVAPLARTLGTAMPVGFL